MNDQYTDLLISTRINIIESLSNHRIVILPPMDIFHSANIISLLGLRSQSNIFDPWYNKGIGGEREDYIPHILSILDSIKYTSDHIFFWGFPQIIACFVERIPSPLTLRCWLTWYYKNSPSKIRGWRSAQMACLHLSHINAKMHVENFLNADQKKRFEEGRLRFIPGPPSVIEESLLCGFVGKDEQTGHPAQKPVSVIEKLILMSTAEDELVIDLVSGSGTTAEAARLNNRFSIICDISEEYTEIAENRLGVKRINLDPILVNSVDSITNGLSHEAIRIYTNNNIYVQINNSVQLSFDIT